MNKGGFNNQRPLLFPKIGGISAALGICLFSMVCRGEENAPPGEATEAPASTANSGFAAPPVFSKISRPPSEEEIRTLEEERKEDIEIFIRRAQDFKDVVDGAVRRTYEKKRRNIESSYELSIEAEERMERKSLEDALEYFKAFLKKYPDAPPYTPDAMYRLGELYYDKAYLDYREQDNAYALAEEEGRASGLEPPSKDFSKTIQIFEDLAERYPDYKNIDAVYYVLGYCLKESGREDDARLAWLAGVCKNKYTYNPAELSRKKAEAALSKKAPRPADSLNIGVASALGEETFVDPFAECEPVTADSRFLFESWWLIGEYHFDYDGSRFGVETAMAAYKKLIENPEHKFYDKGLYKLAWSYFKADMYPEAVATFSAVVDYTEEHPAQKGGSMRPEAVQYLAVCFFTDDWNLDMMPDATTPVDRLQDPSLMPQDRPWTSEVYERLGDIYSDNEKGEEAVQLWTMYLKKWPLALRAPFVLEKIAREYAKMHDPEREIAARRDLDRFGPGSEWWKANEDHPAEQNEVAEMTREALLEAAYHYHRTAQNLRKRALTAQDAELSKRAVEKYALAAEAYRMFIEQNPDSPDIYDSNFNLAESLFWSGEYAKAKEEYKKVRDSNLDDRYREDAAYMVIVSLEEFLKQEEAAGRIEMRQTPPELAGEPPRPSRFQIPPAVLELMNEREAFLKDAPNNENAGKFRYQTAQNYYRYGHWDEAETRYAAIYDDFCETDPIAYVSWQTLMNMASDLNNVDERERLALLQRDRKCNAEGLEKLTGEAEVINIDTVLGDVAVQRALDMLKTCMAEKDARVCSDAGDALAAAVAEAPSHPDADKALHNAALAYEIGGRYDSAMKLYGRIIEEYPKSKYVGKCLFQQASAANNFFEYDKALENYRILADESRFSDYENRAASIYNAAFILTSLKRYEDAVSYWSRYAQEESDADKSVEAAFNAADMYYKARKWRKSLDAFDAFLRAYDRRPEAAPQLVKAAFRTASAHEKIGKTRDKIKAWEKTVALYKRAKDPGSMSAEYAASADFHLIEVDMRKFESFSIRGRMKAVQEKIAQGAAKVKELESRYREIAAYGRPEWSLAAEFRIGYAYEVFAKALLAVPLPPLDPKDEKMLRKLPAEDREMILTELEDKFRLEMENQVSPMEEKAQAEYKIAVELARKGNISNEWTLLALERMNAYEPENYPRRHNGMVEIEEDALAAPPFASEVQ